MTTPDPREREEPRAVLMSRVIAKELNVMDRWSSVDPTTYEGGNGVASVTEAELLTAGATRVEWGLPDEHGWYTPTLYSELVRCAECGRAITRPWIDGVQLPWKHWVEPLGHPARLKGSSDD